MKKILKYSILIWMLTSCQEFLEPVSQSEYVPNEVKSLDELLLGEAYAGAYFVDANFYSVLGLFDDDVAIRRDWAGDDSEEDAVLQLRLAFSWDPTMLDEFNNYDVYSQVYEKILGCNAALDYVDGVDGSEDDKNRVRGQALALRSYFYWFLVNLYGQPYGYNADALGVPLKLNSDLQDKGMPRNTVGEVYDQIEHDLLEAERFYKALPEDKQNLHDNRVNLPFIQLMLSRVYLYMENWEQAYVYGKKIIDDYSYDVLDLNSLESPEYTGYYNFFTWNNPEVLFLFGNIYDVARLPYYLGFIRYENKIDDWSETYNYILPVASDSLLGTYEDADLRKIHYLMLPQSPDGRGADKDYRAAYSKFPIQGVGNYNLNYNAGAGLWGTAFKVTEAYLNAAEAAAMLYGERQSEYMAQAQNLMTDLRTKRFPLGSPSVAVTETNPDALIQLVRDERRRELCFENHRWFDLRRYGMKEIKHVWYDESGHAIEYTLQQNDPGYTLLIPRTAFTYNSSMVQNEIRSTNTDDNE